MFGWGFLWGFVGFFLFPRKKVFQIQSEIFSLVLCVIVIDKECHRI